MWTGANLGGIGRLGDAALAATCLPAPGDTNPHRQICGGIYFADPSMAMAWPGAPMLHNVPSVVNTLYDPVMPVSFPLWGPVGPPPPPTVQSSAAAVSPNPGAALVPGALVTPMPTITPIQPGRISSEGLGIGCSVSKFAADSPVLAVAAAALVWWMLRGGKF